MAAVLCTGFLLQSSQCQGSPAQSSQGSASSSILGAGESGSSGSLSFSLPLRLDRSDISLFALTARASAHLRVATLTSTGYSLLARRLTTRRTRILTYSLLFFCLKLNTYLQHHHCCSCTFIRRQNGLCGLSTQQSLLILVDHTASSNQALILHFLLPNSIS